MVLVLIRITLLLLLYHVNFMFEDFGHMGEENIFGGENVQK